MTYRDYRSCVNAIQEETFQSNTEHPLDAGILRARFREAQLQRLVSLTETVDFATAKRRGSAWSRQLVKVRNARTRFEKLKAELSSHAQAVAVSGNVFPLF